MGYGVLDSPVEGAICGEKKKIQSPSPFKRNQDRLTGFCHMLAMLLVQPRASTGLERSRSGFEHGTNTAVGGSCRGRWPFWEGSFKRAFRTLEPFGMHNYSTGDLL